MSEIGLLENPKSAISESIKILRTNLQFSNVDGNLKTIMITSSVPGEGKSFTSSKLAIEFANLDKKVLLVDCDMRRGTQYQYFKTDKEVGLSNLLIDTEENYSKYINETSYKNVNMVTSGTVPPNPSELLSSESFDRFINKVKEEYDIVIFDLPPVTIVPDAQIVATKVDKTVIVARIKVTPLPELERTKKMLEAVKANIAGVVLNGVKSSKSNYYDKYYY